MGDIASLVLTVLVPSVLALLLWWFTRDDIARLQAARLERKREGIFRKATPQRIQEWLISYYAGKGEDHHLYAMSSLPTEMIVPFLTRAEWSLLNRRAESLILFPAEPHVASTKHNAAFIERRRKLFGQRLWNQRIYCATKLVSSDTGIQVEVGYGDYYQFLSACGPLADELLFAISDGRKTPYRDKMAPTLDVVETFPCKAHAIGIHSLVIGRRRDGEFSTILHMRSQKVAINRGTFTGVPTFTFQPHAEPDDCDRDMFHSFLREYLEELYDKEEFIRDEADSRRPRADWWYELPEMRPVLELRKRGEARFHILGFGFDPSHCDLVICACLIIDNQDYWEKALGEMKKSWEASSRAFRQEYLLFSSEVDGLLTERLIQPGTAYCLDKARLLLEA